MPITLGCPSCGKRFRARDESAGKRVKCPYCQAAVPVASPDEAQNAAAPTERVPPPAPAATIAAPSVYRPPVSPVPAPVTPAAGWVDESPAPVTPPAPPRSGRLGGSTPFDVMPVATTPARTGKKAGRGVVIEEEKPKKTPFELAAPRWKKARGGLWWILFGLFWLTLPGFVPFAVTVYERSVQSLPAGSGWIVIDGYVNDPDNTAGALKLTKRQEILVLAFGLPLLLAAGALALGRMTCAAVPRSSGAKGMFAFSALGTLVVAAGVAAAAGAYGLGMNREARLIAAGVAVTLLLTEAWFITGLAVCGSALKRPRAARAVGLLVLVAGIVAGLAVAAVARDWEVTSVRPVYDPLPPKDGAKVKEPPGVVEALQERIAEARKQLEQYEKELEVARLGEKNPKMPRPQPNREMDKGKKGGGDGRPQFDLTAAPKLQPELPPPTKYEVRVRREKHDEDAWMYASGGGMIAWLLLIGVYWRAVAAARWAIRDAVERVEDIV